jgi:hypothetical protein
MVDSKPEIGREKGGKTLKSEEKQTLPFKSLQRYEKNNGRQGTPRSAEHQSVIITL